MTTGNGRVAAKAVVALDVCDLPIRDPLAKLERCQRT